MGKSFEDVSEYCPWKQDTYIDYEDPSQNTYECIVTKDECEEWSCAIWYIMEEIK